MRLFGILFCIFFLSCATSKVTFISSDTSRLQIGKCYYSESQYDDSLKVIEEQFVLEFIKPEYKVVKKEILINQIHFEDDKSVFSLKVKPRSFKYVMKSGRSKLMQKSKFPQIYNICVDATPDIYRHFKKADFNKGRLEIDFHQLVKEAMVIKKNVNSKPLVLKSNEKYIIGQNFSGFKEVEEVIMHPSILSPVQNRLIELGYDLEETGKMDSKTKKALRDYQMKNNLKVGQIDFDTIRSLGLLEDRDN